MRFAGRRLSDDRPVRLSKTQQKWGDPAIRMQKVNPEVISPVTRVTVFAAPFAENCS
jgi:hypothetical protein